MAQFDRLTVLNAMIDTGLIPVFYHPDAQTTIAIAEACVAGGVRAVECTNRGDLAHKVFAATMEHFLGSDSGVMLGVGSVVDAPTAALYIANGTNFVVGPLLNPDVARLCNRRKVPVLGPGLCPRAASTPPEKAWKPGLGLASPASALARSSSRRRSSKLVIMRR